MFSVLRDIAVFSFHDGDLVGLELETVGTVVRRAVTSAVGIICILNSIEAGLLRHLLVVEPQSLVDLVLVRSGNVGESLADVRHGGHLVNTDIDLKVVAGLVEFFKVSLGSSSGLSEDLHQLFTLLLLERRDLGSVLRDLSILHHGLQQINTSTSEVKLLLVCGEINRSHWLALLNDNTIDFIGLGANVVEGSQHSRVGKFLRDLLPANFCYT
mmetsp:Transcript_108241/g.233213  ORF Transcript_108241/g.233213 Transcript_108241/m.233213 type:complete len:213 (+) Transcript_108241:134-772(+)